ncbi:hypothetical protein DNL40_07785 [Xylanimonas oleitrophica]|uniref:Uncharacterized protein n=1 Tax=Xylanimonas oleitrophica TaxID=2607479 RepID=A0A2W5Y5N9_9MICO|nr:hypothetical protein [Xylanimonas oleitrophica]PZR53404.1 hypothetical protein DNL40_07785 [Xylanimonas oleitrophica]
MRDLTTGAASTRAPALAAGSTVPAGSPAHQAYDRAVKRLAEAQQQLTRHLLEQAPEEVVEAARTTGGMAAAAVAAAAATLAREQQGSLVSGNPSPMPVPVTLPHEGRVRLTA